MVPTQQGGTRGGPTLIAEVDAETFRAVLKKTDRRLVLHLHTGMPKAHKYLTRYAGYFFLTKSKEPLDFLLEVEVIHARKLHTSLEWPVL